MSFIKKELPKVSSVELESGIYTNVRLITFHDSVEITCNKGQETECKKETFELVLALENGQRINHNIFSEKEYSRLVKTLAKVTNNNTATDEQLLLLVTNDSDNAYNFSMIVNHNTVEDKTFTNISFCTNVHALDLIKQIKSDNE